LLKRLNEAKSQVKKTFQKYEVTFEKHAEHQATCERYNATGRIKDYDKQLAKVKAARQKLDESTDKHEDAKANLDRLRQAIERTESPRLMARMRELETGRMKASLGYLLELIELERRCASMDERYASEMVGKLRQIDLHADDQHFSRMHVDSSGICTGAMLNLTVAKPIISTPPINPVSPDSKQAIKQQPIELYPGYMTDGLACSSQPPAYSLENLALDDLPQAALTRSVHSVIGATGGCAGLTHSKSVGSLSAQPLYSCSIGNA